MQMLAFPELTPEQLAATAHRHGLAGVTYARLPQIGVINAIYALGDDHILRVPRDHPGTLDQFRNEIVAAPHARAAGVRTPRLN